MPSEIGGECEAGDILYIYDSDLERFGCIADRKGEHWMFRYVFKLLNVALGQINAAAEKKQGAALIPPAGFSDLSPKTAAQKPNAANIPDSEYQNRTDLTEFTVPEGVQSIGSDAFRDCSNLQKITLPETLLEIGSRAFLRCSALTEIVIPDSVRKIGNDAFSDCIRLRSFRFPKGMNGAELEHGILHHCAALETVELPNRLTGPFDDVFSRCSSLRTVRMPEGITEIGSFAFYGCKRLEHIEIPSTVTSLEHRAFQGCESLREIVIPDTVKTIDGEKVFMHCANLESIRLPVGVTFRLERDEDDDDEENVKSVAECFSGCNALKTVILGRRKFRLQGTLDDNTLLFMRAELAASGDKTAQELTAQDIDTALWLLIQANRTETAAALLRCYGEDVLTKEVLQSAIDAAGVTGREDILRMLREYCAGRNMGENT